MNTLNRPLPDQLNSLFNHGLISLAQFEAGTEIRKHWASPDRSGSVFLNWEMVQDATLITDGIRVRRSRVVQDMLVLNHTARDVEAAYRWAEGKALEHLKAALDAYAPAVAVAAE